VGPTGAAGTSATVTIVPEGSLMTMAVPACENFAMLDKVSVTTKPGQTIHASISGSFVLAANSTTEANISLCLNYTNAAGAGVTVPFTNQNYVPKSVVQDLTWMTQRFDNPSTGANPSLAKAISVTVSGAVTLGSGIPAGNVNVGLCSFGRAVDGATVCFPIGSNQQADQVGFAQGFVEVTQ
jgi:hypothetical protein